MSDKVKIRLTHPDLINRFGITPTVPYSWAMEKIKNGHAVLFRPSDPPKVSQSNPVSPAQHIITHNPQKSYEIVWVQDYNFIGGAELSSQLVIDVGKDLGFDICMITPQNFDLRTLRRAKLLILNNIFTFTGTQMAELKRTIFEFQVPYVKYEHDMRETYPERLSFSRRLFAHSKMNVLISPLQKEVYCGIIPNMGYTITLPLAVDTSKFQPNSKIKRIKNKAIHTSGNLHNKGAAKLLSMVNAHTEMQFDIYPGDNRQIIQMFSELPNVTLKQRVTHDKMADIYNEAEYLVHLPTGIWAGERVVLEAALCGCKLVINDNVGHKSWGWDFGNTKALRAVLDDAPHEFWRKVEEIM